MNEELEMDGLVHVYTIEGDTIGTIEVSNIEFDIIPEDSRVFIPSKITREISIPLENVVVNMEHLDIRPQYDLEVKILPYPRGKRLPKKKRINKKWRSKYHRIFIDFEVSLTDYLKNNKK